MVAHAEEEEAIALVGTPEEEVRAIPLFIISI